MKGVREECGCCLWQRPIFSAACGEEKRRGEGHTLPRYWPPAVHPPTTPPAPLPSDEWWYLLKVKPAGEPWLGLGRQGETTWKITETNPANGCALQSPIHFTKLAYNQREAQKRKKKRRSVGA